MYQAKRNARALSMALTRRAVMLPYRFEYSESKDKQGLIWGALTCRAVMMGNRPTNSGMSPYVIKSVCSTCCSTSSPSAFRAPDSCRALTHTFIQCQRLCFHHAQKQSGTVASPLSPCIQKYIPGGCCALRTECAATSCRECDVGVMTAAHHNYDILPFGDREQMAGQKANGVVR